MGRGGQAQRSVSPTPRAPFCGGVGLWPLSATALVYVLAPVTPFPAFLSPASPRGCAVLPRGSSVLDATLSCPWLRYGKWRETLTAAEFVLSRFPVPLPSCDVPNPGALTADSGPFPGALGKLWKGVGVISGVRVWERGGSAAEAGSPLGDTPRLPQCPCQAWGTHVSKGAQSVWWHQAAVAPASAVAGHPPSFSHVTAQGTWLLYSAFVCLGPRPSRDG